MYSVERVHWGYVTQSVIIPAAVPIHLRLISSLISAVSPINCHLVYSQLPKLSSTMSSYQLSHSQSHLHSSQSSQSPAQHFCYNYEMQRGVCICCGPKKAEKALKFQPMGLYGVPNGVHHILDSLERYLWQKKLLLMWNKKTPSFWQTFF